MSEITVSQPLTNKEIQPVETKILGSREQNKGIRVTDLEAAIGVVDGVTIQGLDGTPVKIWANEDVLEIKEGTDFVFTALLIGDRVELTIKNEHAGQKSKTIFPKQLLQFVLEKWASRVKVVKGHWSTVEGTNTEQYQLARTQGKSPGEAALTTWTGRTLAELGFSRVTKVEELARWIVVSFERL